MCVCVFYMYFRIALGRSLALTWKGFGVISGPTSGSFCGFVWRCCKIASMPHCYSGTFVLGDVGPSFLHHSRNSSGIYFCVAVKIAFCLWCWQSLGPPKDSPFRIDSQRFCVCCDVFLVVCEDLVIFRSSFCDRAKLLVVQCTSVVTLLEA